MEGEGNKSKLGQLVASVRAVAQQTGRAVLYGSRYISDRVRFLGAKETWPRWAVHMRVGSNRADQRVVPCDFFMARESIGKYGQAGKDLGLWLLSDKRGRLTLKAGLLAVVLLVGLFVVFGPNAVVVSMNGQEIGVARSGSVVRAAVNDLHKEIETLGWNSVDNSSELSIKRFRAASGEVLTPEVLRERLREALGCVVEGVAICINGNPAAWVKDQATAEQVVAMAINSFIPTKDTTQVLSVTPEETVEYRAGAVNINEILTPEEALSIMKTGVPQDQQYIVVEGNNMWSVAQEHGVSVEGLQAANPQVKGEFLLQIGEVLKLTKAEPALHVVVTRESQVTDKIPFSVQTQQDNSLYRGQEHVIQKGADGLKTVTYRLVERNGAQVSREELDRQITQEPVPQIVAQGTKGGVTTVASRGATSLRVGSGKLAWPLRGPINSGYGYRGSEFHGGIDIGGAYGASVRSAGGGTVTFAGTQGGYGRTVLIDHGNGLVTRYAHLSVISVRSGQTVGQGDQIGNVGTSGRTTGPHLHFEVIVGGSTRSPLSYLS